MSDNTDITGIKEASSAYGVIGQPIEHSLSPLIHRHFAALTEQTLSYDLVTAPADGFVSAATAFFNGGGAGLNVTLPFKEQAHDLVERLSPAAAVAGAVNTIRPADGILEGHNTDGLGLVKDLEGNLGWQIADAKVLLIGAGGASRGALASLLASKPGALVLTNRTLDRARSLVADVAPDDGRVQVCAAAELNHAFDLVINATSASLAGQGALVPTEAVRDARCYDMLYAPAQTVFAGWALSHGAGQVSDGLGMLLEQAAEAFALWRGVRPDTASLLADREALFAAKKAGAASLAEFLASDSKASLGESPNAESPDQAAGNNSRFIAGAVCPECRAIDRIVVRDIEGGLGREQACIACGFSQPEQTDMQQVKHGLVPRGKPERKPAATDTSIESQPVRFIDPNLSASTAQQKASKKAAEKPNKKTD